MGTTNVKVRDCLSEKVTYKQRHVETSGKATKAYGTSYAKIINWVLKVFHHNLNIQRKTGKKNVTG